MDAYYFQQYGKEIVSLLVPVIAWALSRASRPSVKLYASTPHEFMFRVPRPADADRPTESDHVYTRSVIIWNDGSTAATNVEIVFDSAPQCLNAWPGRVYETKPAPDGRHVLTLGSLAPKEQFGCELLSILTSLPNVITVRCNEGVAEPVRTYPQGVTPPWKRNVQRFLGWAGVAAIVYVAMILVQWLVLRTPLGP